MNVSTLGVLSPFSLIVNMLLAKFYLKEPFKKWEIIGISLFIPGAILSLIFSSKQNNRYTLEEVNNLFLSFLSMGYILTNLILIIVGLICSYYILHKFPSDEDHCPIANHTPSADLEFSNSIDLDQSKEQELPSVETKYKAIRKIESFDSVADLNFEDDSVWLYDITKIFTSRRSRIIPLIILPYTACF